MAISISGTAYTDEGVTPMGSGRTVAVSVNGAAAAGTTTTAAGGTYTISGITAASGAVLTLYLQGNTEVGVTVTKSTGSNMTGIDIYQDGLSLRSDQSSLNGTNLNTSDNNGDSGLTAIYAITSNFGPVTLASGKHLYIQTGQTFAAAIAFNCFANVSNRGTMSSISLTVKGSGTVRSNGGSVGTFTLDATGTYTLLDDLKATSNMVLTGGTLDVSASNYTVSLQNGLTVTAGVFVCRSGTVIFTDVSGTRAITGAAGNFYNVTHSGAAICQASANVVVLNNFTNSGGTFDLNGKTITIGGNFANSATFTASSGTVTLNGANQTISGSTTFYNLTKIVASAATLTFTDGTTQTVSNALTLQGASGQLLTLAGTSTGGWTIAVPATQTLDHLSVSHSTATVTTAAAGSSVDGGSNVNWTFGSAGVHPWWQYVSPMMGSLAGKI